MILVMFWPFSAIFSRSRAFCISGLTMKKARGVDTRRPCLAVDEHGDW